MLRSVRYETKHSLLSVQNYLKKCHGLLQYPRESQSHYSQRMYTELPSFDAFSRFTGQYLSKAHWHPESTSNYWLLVLRPARDKHDISLLQ